MELIELDCRLDVLGLSVLNYFKNIPVFKNSILAGGYIRDLICKKQFKDIDIFIPRNTVYDVMNGLQGLSSDYKVIKMGEAQNFHKFKSYSTGFVTYDLLYLDAIPIQIIMTPFRENFKNSLIDSFDYGLCQVLAEDQSIYGTAEFLYDKKNNCASLLTLEDISHLPRHMKRFVRFTEKFPDLQFRCPRLKMNYEKKKEDTVKVKDPVWYTSVGAGTLAANAPTNNPMHLILYTDIELLNMTLSDVTFEHNSLDWNILDQMLGSSNANIAEHGQSLIDEWDGLHPETTANHLDGPLEQI